MPQTFFYKVPNEVFKKFTRFAEFKQISEGYVDPDRDKGLKNKSAAQLLGIDSGRTYEKLVKQDEIILSKKNLNTFSQAGADFLGRKQVFEHLEFKTYSELHSNLIIEFTTILRGEPYKQPQVLKSNVNASLRDIENSFRDSQWYCYIRNENRNGARLGKHIISFKRFGKSHKCDVEHQHFSNKVSRYFGSAKIISSNLMILNLQNEENFLQLMFKIENKLDDLKVCIGHITYNHRINGNIITKTLLLQKCQPGESPKPEVLNFDDVVKKDISKFFRSKNLNRLSSPRKIKIFDFDTLHDWIKLNRPPEIATFKVVTGRYFLFFKVYPHKDGFLEDQIELSLSDEGGINATFIHDLGGGKRLVWKGRGLPNSDTKLLSIRLRGPFDEDADIESLSNIDNNPIFLILNLPSNDTPNVEVVTGIISGYRDTETGAVARLFVLVKKENERFPGKHKIKEIHDFLNRNKDRCWVRPPFPSIALFSDLTKS